MKLSLIDISFDANILLAVITGYYAFLTQRLVAANKRFVELSERQIEAQSRPYVDVSPIVREGAKLFQLRIRNSGRSTAKELRLTLTPDFYNLHTKTKDHLMQSFYAFRKPIKSFSPGMELVIDLGAGFQFFQGPENDAVSPPCFTVSASYSSESRTYQENTIVDLHVFHHTSAASVGTLQELKEMNKSIEEISSATRDIAKALEVKTNH